MSRTNYKDASISYQKGILPRGRIADDDRLIILMHLGTIAQKKYNEFIVLGGAAKGYSLDALKGSLQFAPDVENFTNLYWLEGTDEHWTKIAQYFEYGTGLFNTKRAGKYHAGYIRPVVAEYMRFLTKKGKRHWVTTDRVKGVHPIFGMEKAQKYIEYNRDNLIRSIRTEL